MELTIKEWKRKIKFLEAILTKDNNKFNYSIKKVLDRIGQGISSHEKEFNIQAEDLRMHHAATYPADYSDVEKKGKFILDGEKYTYTASVSIEFNKSYIKLDNEFNDQKVKVEPFYAKIGEGWEAVNEVDMFIADELKGILFEFVEEGKVVEGKEDTKIKK